VGVLTAEGPCVGRDIDDCPSSLLQVWVKVFGRHERSLELGQLAHVAK
jgi:hypothetical protein